MKNYIFVGVAGLLLGALMGALVFSSQPEPTEQTDELGGYLTTKTNPHYFSSTVKVGTNGSTITELKANTCNLANADTSIAATSTGYVYCAITGVASGDLTLVQLSTTTANALFGGWTIQSSKASTTAGMIDVRLYNGTGAAAVPSVTSVGSSTNAWYMDN